MGIPSNSKEILEQIKFLLDKYDTIVDCPGCSKCEYKKLCHKLLDAKHLMREIGIDGVEPGRNK